MRSNRGSTRPDETVAFQDRQDVVAVLALRRRHVHLEPIAEAEQGLGPVAIVHEPVERRQHRDPVGHGLVAHLGMRDPLAFLEPDAERTEALLGEATLRLAQGHRLGLGVPALAEVPEALLALTADDRHVTADAEDLQHQAGAARAPPAVPAVPAHRVLEVA